MGGSWCCVSPRWSSPPPRRKATYFTVVYKGNFPPGDPFQTVRVARNDTKKMTVGAAATTAITNPAAARPSNNNAAAALIQNTGGKKVAVLENLP
uniref:Uncharacterized protein n=1 Tax=Oryza punctata TaxID=4537 RepID=A0A0E0KGF6_ORYPU